MWYTPIITIWLLAMSIFDIKSRRVPVWLLAFGGVLSLLAIGMSGGLEELSQGFRGMLPGILLLGIAFFTGKAGYGDGIVLLLLGMVGKGVALLGVSVFFMSIASVLLLLLRRADRNTRIPYLPFLAAAWLLTMEI